MALHLNLLHEEILEQRQRQRDPLKIGILVLAVCGALLFIYYAWNGYRTLEIKGRLGTVEATWKKIEPKVTAAQKRSADLTALIKTTRVLDEYIENRFFWGPFLEILARCVAPYAQLTNIDGTVLEDDKGVSVSIDGVAAGREPRAAAEDFRQMLIEQLAKSYGNVKVEFKDLEDVDTIVNIGGATMPMAHYTLTVTLNSALAKPKATPPTVRSKR